MDVLSLMEYIDCTFQILKEDVGEEVVEEGEEG